jgi:hypothetical protein
MKLDLASIQLQLSDRIHEMADNKRMQPDVGERALPSAADAKRYVFKRVQ